MAKEKISSSQAIRDALAEKPDMKTNDVVEYLATKNVVVTKGLVYQVKAKMGEKKSEKDTPAARKTPVPQAASTNGTVSMAATVMELKALAERIGGIDELIALAQAVR